MVHIATEVHFLKMSSRVTQLAFYEDDLDIIEDSDADTLSLESVPKKELPSVRLKKSKKKPKSKWQIFLDKIASGTVFENHLKSRTASTQATFIYLSKKKIKNMFFLCSHGSIFRHSLCSYKQSRNLF